MYTPYALPTSYQNRYPIYLTLFKRRRRKSVPGRRPKSGKRRRRKYPHTYHYK